MNIAWRYLDKKNATIAALRDYENMTCIVNLTADEIKNIQCDMVSPRGQQITGMPKGNSPYTSEDALIHSIEKIDILKQRYRTATEYMEWFVPAWETLSAEEQIVLSDFYLINGDRTCVIDDLSERLCCGRSEIYRKKDKALEHLTVLLFGY